MKFIPVFLFLLCASPAFAGPLDTLSSGALSGPIIVGTLADANNPVEMATSPSYTRLIVLRQRTARTVVAQANAHPEKAQSLFDTAGAIQAKADAARDLLDSINGQREVTPLVTATISRANDEIFDGEKIYDTHLGGAK